MIDCLFADKKLSVKMKYNFNTLKFVPAYNAA